jgi:hypothetical protein
MNCPAEKGITMNNHRSHDYENYVNSYGIRELFREAGEARRLRDLDSGRSGAANTIRIALRLSPVVVVVVLLIHFLG